LLDFVTCSFVKETTMEGTLPALGIAIAHFLMENVRYNGEWSQQKYITEILERPFVSVIQRFRRPGNGTWVETTLRRLDLRWQESAYDYNFLSPILWLG
jgi:hypothetical protein